MAGNYKIKIEPILNTASLNKQLNETKKLKLDTAGQSAGASFMSGFGRAIKERAKYSIANFLIYGAQNAIKDMVANVKELDAAQTEFKKVSDLAGAALEKYTERAYQAGETVAKTGTQMIQAATEFKKSGFSESDSLLLAKVASMYQNVADVELDAGEAASFIISQMKAFNLEAKDAEHIIDAVNEVSNKYAVSSADIATNIGKASATLAEGNVTYEQSIGLLTAMTEITRSGSKAARGLVTIQSRYNQIIDESSSTGKKLSAWYKEHNIEIKDQNGQLRSFYDVASDVADIWDTLDKNERLYYRNIQAGATQSQNLAALMRNFGTAADATATAMDSAGSAAKENEKYLDSIQGHLQSFTSAWEKLSYHLIDSNTIKSLIDIGTGAINTIDKIILVLDKLPGKLGAVVGIAGVIGTILGAKKLWSIAEGFVGIGEAVGTVGTAAKQSSPLFSYMAKQLTTWISTGSILATSLPLIAGGIAGIAAAILIAKKSYDESFRGKIGKYREIGDEIESIRTEIDALNDKEGELTHEEETRLNLLKMQLAVLEKQQALTQKEATAAFNKEAKKKLDPDATGYAKDSQVDVGGNYIKAMRERINLEEQIAAIERDREKGIAINEAELNKLTKRYEEVLSTESDWLDALMKEEELLADVDYNALDEWGKAYYDNIHKAYLQAQTDIREVQDAVGNAIDAVGSEQFDAWNIDISSLKSADDLIAQIKEKISGMDEDAEITFKVKNDDGSFEEVTKKVSELTDEEIEAIVHFEQDGAEKIEEVKEDAAKDTDSTIYVSEEGAEAAKASIEAAAKNRDSLVTYEEKGAAQVKKAGDDAAKARTATVSFVAKGLSYIQSAWNNLKASLGFASGKRKGEEGGMAWLGDEGSRSNPKPELVVSADGKAYLAGTTGWEMYPVKDSDTVYTYSETKRLLGDKQSFRGFAGNLPRYKKGKKKKSKKQKKRDEFDKKLEQLNHNRKVKHWTDAKYQSEYKKLYNKYKKWLKKDQKWDYTEDREDYENEKDTKEIEKLIDDITPETLDSVINRINKSDNLSSDEKQELRDKAIEAANKISHDRFTSEVDRRTGLISAVGTSGLTGLVKDIQSNQYLSAEEKKEAISKAYETAVEYNLKEYKNGKATREQILEDIQNYYNARGQEDETYYKMLDELREADKEKELKRLEELQKLQDSSLSLAQKYLQRELNNTRKKIDAQKEETDQAEKLEELQEQLVKSTNDLNKAKITRVRIYREGIGFVYEQDMKAVEEASKDVADAQKAIADYNKSLEKSDLEKYADELQAILDLFDDLANNSEIKELELLLGVGSLSELTRGDLGTDLGQWSNWIRNILIASTAFADLIEQLNNATGSDIDRWLSDNQQVNAETLAEYIRQHSFASGTLSAPGGLSRVGERLGGELVWLGKGDSVYSNAVSRNLMEWGRYNPAQVMNSNSSASTQVFNFDQIVLPNVRNANDFYRELQNLPNQALQQATKRA